MTESSSDVRVLDLEPGDPASAVLILPEGSVRVAAGCENIEAWLSALAGASASDQSLDVLWSFADPLAAEIAEERVGVLLLPSCLRTGRPGPCEDLAATALQWALERRGILVVAPMDEGEVAVDADNLETVAILREPDRFVRAQAWIERWESLLGREEEANGDRRAKDRRMLSERASAAGYLLGDAEAMEIALARQPWIGADLDALRQEVPPIDWTPEVSRLWWKNAAVGGQS